MSDFKPMKIMLDSGAFSAWTRGETIDLGDYIKFIVRHRELLDIYINLDVIPGRRGGRASVREVERAAAASFENYQAMRAAGLDPLPVFHYGESFDWLERLLDSGAGYICLGGTVGLRTGVKKEFLDKCFTRLTDREGRPFVRVHGLGVTEGKFLMRYPWYSADSTSWCIAPIYGIILVPGVVRGSFSTQLYVGVGGELDKRVGSRHLDFMPESVQKHVHEFVASCGFTITDLRNDLYARTAVFARCLVVAQSQVGGCFLHRRGGFGVDRPARSARGIVVPEFRMIFAANIVSGFYQSILRGAGAEHHLRSYYEHMRNPEGFAEYVAFINSETRYSTEQRVRPRAKWGSMSYHDHRRRLLAARIDREDEHGEEAVA